MSGGGRFDFDDGGTYCGGWEEGKAHGHGVCTGPKGQGEYAGAWQLGFELNGVYLWPSGNRYEGQWTQGKRHGLGSETKGRWSYKGEWTQGFKGRYGVRLSTSTGAKYEGTWTTGLQDGYGVETYADGGEYKGQWLRGMRHGYGTRQSVPYGVAASYHAKTQHQSASPTSASHAAADADEDAGSKRERGLHRADESRGGFVLKSHSDDAAATAPGGRRSFLDKHGKGPLSKILRLSLRKQHSTGDLQDPNAGRRTMGASIRSTASTMSRLSNDSGKTAMTSGSVNTIDSNHSFVTQDDAIEPGVVETYMGEWKNDKRSGFGVSERTDGLKYVGEWYNNKKYGYGVTTLRDGTKEEGKYKNNVLVSSGNKSKLLFAIRSSKLRERIDSAVAAAVRAGQIAKQKADIAVSRMQTAKAKAELAEVVSQKARSDAEIARQKAKEFAPDFQQPGLNNFQKTTDENDYMVPNDSHEYIKPQKATANHMSANTMPRANGNGGLSSSANSNSAMMATYNYYPSTPGTKEITIPASSSSSLSKQQQQQQQQLSGMRTPSSAASLQTTANTSRTPSTLDRQMSNNNSTSASTAAGTNNKYRRQESLESAASAAALLRQRNTDSIRSHRSTGGASNTLPHHGKPSSASEYGSEMMDGDDGASHYSNYRSRHSPSRESQVTSSDYGSVSGRSQTPRRKSLPSIVKNKEGAIAAIKADQQQQKPASSSSASRNKVQQPQMRALKPQVDYGAHYIIENGVRKRITTESEATGGDDAWQGEEGAGGGEGEAEDLVADLPRRYRVETPRLQRRAGGALGSLPDVSVCQELSQAVMPREQVYVLSERRRDELRRLREEEERRRHMQVVLSLYDFKDWCQQRQMVMLILALNIGLATMFFQLLR